MQSFCIKKTIECKRERERKKTKDVWRKTQIKAQGKKFDVNCCELGSWIEWYRNKATEKTKSIDWESEWKKRQIIHWKRANKTTNDQTKKKQNQQEWTRQKNNENSNLSECDGSW